MRKSKVKTVERPQGSPSNLVQNLISNSPDIPRLHTRKEGHALPLRRRDDVSAVGGGARFGIDMTSAPIPQRRYAAELCSVIYERNEAKIIFAQPKWGVDELDSALVIRMSPVAITQLAESIHEIPSPSVQEICDRVGVEPESLSQFSSHPKQIANVVANICAIAIAGHETCMDFYHASAFATRKSETSDELEVEPVVRVDLRTSLLVPLIQCIFDIEAKISAAKERGPK